MCTLTEDQLSWLEMEEYDPAQWTWTTVRGVLVGQREGYASLLWREDLEEFEIGGHDEVLY